jgi:hypothetical protein
MGNGASAVVLGKREIKRGRGEKVFSFLPSKKDDLICLDEGYVLCEGGKFDLLVIDAGEMLVGKKEWVISEYLILISKSFREIPDAN